MVLGGPTRAPPLLLEWTWWSDVLEKVEDLAFYGLSSFRMTQDRRKDFRARLVNKIKVELGSLRSSNRRDGKIQPRRSHWGHLESWFLSLLFLNLSQPDLSHFPSSGFLAIPHS